MTKPTAEKWVIYPMPHAYGLKAVTGYVGTDGYYDLKTWSPDDGAVSYPHGRWFNTREDALEAIAKKGGQMVEPKTP